MAGDLQGSEDGDDDPLHGGDEVVEDGIVAAILDHVAGMADGGAVAAEGLADIGLRDPQRHMTDIHGDLPDMAGHPAPVAADEHAVAEQQDHLPHQLADDAAGGLQRGGMNGVRRPADLHRRQWRSGGNGVELSLG